MEPIRARNLHIDYRFLGYQMFKHIIHRFTAVNVLILIVFTVLLSELLTSLMSIILYGRITYDYLITGGVVSFLAASILLYLIKHITRLAEINEQLQQEILQRKQMEAAFKKTSDDWRITFDSTKDAILMLDRNFHIIKANSSATTFFHMSFHDLSDKTIFELFEKAGIPTDTLPIPRVKDTRIHEVEELYIPGRDSWISVSADPILDHQGTFHGLVLIIRDISELKRMHIQIEKAKEDWVNTFDTINDAITIHDKDFNIMRANKAASELLGLPFRAILAQKCFVSYHGTACPPEGCPSCKTLETGIPSTVKLFEPNLDKYLEIKALARYNKENKIIGLIHIVRDITKEKKTEEEVERTHQMTRTILGKSPYGIFVVDNRGIIDYVNEAMLRMNGEDYDRFLGVNAFEHPPNNTLGITEKLRSAINGQSFSLGPVEYTSYYGRKKTFRHFTGIPFEEGREKKALIFVEDVTERKRAEEEQKKLHDQLIHAQKMESIGRLAAGIAHDFNNILSSILGYSELALMRLPDKHSLRDIISNVHHAGQKASELVKQLLIFSRQQILEMKVVDIAAIINDMAHILKRVVSENVILEFDTNAPVKKILADKTQIEQILMNLVINAVDAMPNGGKITIHTSQQDPPSLRGQDSAALSYVLLTVTDTGKGILREDQEKIFEPFYTTKEAGKGTGLGLATVYSIVSQHNGIIFVNSEIDRGTTFTIYLPATEGLREGELKQRYSEYRTGSETVLVTDDDSSVCTFAASSLRTLGYTVLKAQSADEAMHVSNTYKGTIDLLLTDIIMPTMDGKTLSGHIQAYRPETKVIFMSGYSDEVIGNHGLLNPGIHLIRKPLSLSSLAQNVREILDESR